MFTAQKIITAWEWRRRKTQDFGGSWPFWIVCVFWVINCLVTSPLLGSPLPIPSGSGIEKIHACLP